MIFISPFILGSLSVLSFQPFNFSYINFIIFPLLFLITTYVQKKSKSTYRKKPYLSNIFFIGYLFGIGFFLTGIHWISHSLSFDENFKYIIPLSIIGLPLFLGLFFGFANLLAGQFIKNNFTSILIFSSSFAFFDFLRSKILSGFPWNLWAYTWSSLPEVLQPLKFIGLFSFNLISITFFCLPLLLIFKKKSNFILLSMFIFIFFSNYIYGSLTLNQNKDYIKTLNSKNISLNLKIISPNLDLQYNLTDKDTERLVTDLIRYSDPQSNKKTIFIWPEGVFAGVNLQSIKNYTPLFKKNFSEDHLILFGINKKEINNGVENIFNTLIVTNNNLDIIYEYKKRKLVPFGEFLPIENFFIKFGLKKITEGYGSFSNGAEQPLLNIDSFKILTLICYEIIFPELSKTIDEKNLIINISEDAWFGKSIGPYQHFSKAIFRAVENDVFVARSANKGISAFINNKGVIEKNLSPDETGAIEMSIPTIKNSSKKYKKDLIFFILLFTYVFIFLSNKKLNEQK